MEFAKAEEGAVARSDACLLVFCLHAVARVYIHSYAFTRVHK